LAIKNTVGFIGQQNSHNSAAILIMGFTDSNVCKGKKIICKQKTKQKTQQFYYRYQVIRGLQKRFLNH